MSEPRNKPYKGKRWARVREKVLKDDKYLCQRCLGNYMPDPYAVRKRTPAVLVHHHYHVEDFPQWTYSKYVYINGERRRNLYSLCTACHEYIHRDTHRPKNRNEHDSGFTTDERWD
jgi:5-methylcytosine-specific restriction endonuclease McrA